MALYTPTVVISMKFVPILGDIEVVMCSVLYQNIIFLYEETNWSEHSTTLACFCLKFCLWLFNISIQTSGTFLFKYFSHFSFKFLV